MKQPARIDARPYNNEPSQAWRIAAIFGVNQRGFSLGVDPDSLSSNGSGKTRRKEGRSMVELLILLVLCAIFFKIAPGSGVALFGSAFLYFGCDWNGWVAIIVGVIAGGIVELIRDYMKHPEQYHRKDETQ